MQSCFPDQVCPVCRRRLLLLSAGLGVCGDCIRDSSDKAIGITSALHAEARQAFELPVCLVRIGNRHLLSRDY